MRKGSRFTITAGAYDDFEILGTYIATKQFQWQAVISKYLKFRPEQALTGEFNRNEFLMWLQKGYAISVQDTPSFHLEEYKTVFLDDRDDKELKVIRDALDIDCFITRCDAKDKAEIDARYKAHPESFVRTGSNSLPIVKGS